jgi:hypothetical protein
MKLYVLLTGDNMYGFLLIALPISVILNIVLTMSLISTDKKNKNMEYKISKLRDTFRRCPICNTDEFVVYRSGSHAEGKPSNIEGEVQYIPGDCNVVEQCECNKCGGEFSISYEIHNGKTQYLKINYNSSRPVYKDYHTLA